MWRHTRVEQNSRQTNLCTRFGSRWKIQFVKLKTNRGLGAVKVRPRPQPESSSTVTWRCGAAPDILRLVEDILVTRVLLGSWTSSWRRITESTTNQLHFQYEELLQMKSTPHVIFSCSHLPFIWYCFCLFLLLSYQQGKSWSLLFRSMTIWIAGFVLVASTLLGHVSYVLWVVC